MRKLVPGSETTEVVPGSETGLVFGSHTGQIFTTPPVYISIYQFLSVTYLKKDTDNITVLKAITPKVTQDQKHKCS